MANMVLPPADRVDTTPVVAVGFEAEGTEGNHYIYLKGVANTKAGSAVIYNQGTGVTALAAPASRGPIAFAVAAIGANQYGWYLMNGAIRADGTAGVTSGAQLYMAAAGGVTGTVSATNAISNAFAIATTGAAGPVDIQARYPFAGGAG